MNTEDIEQVFYEEHPDFTISVVTSAFAVQRGHSFFKSYENSPNFIENKGDYERLLNRILRYISKNVPALSTIIERFFTQAFTPKDIRDVVDSLFKLFSAHEHQAAGPEVVDPIIIREQMFANKDIATLVNLHRDSVLRPRIIVILRDNNLDRAKSLLRYCHHGLRVRLIDNSGLVQTSTVVNTGVDNIEDFLDIYARQCFDSCSRTSSSIIYNEEWAGKSPVRTYGPQLLRFRTSVIYDSKASITDKLDGFLADLSRNDRPSEIELGFRCLAHLFRVYCYDAGGQDIVQAAKIAEEIDSDVLRGHTFRYAHFIPNLSLEEKNENLLRAEKIFDRERMADHSAYCANNRLVNSFYEDHVSVSRFQDLLSKARADVPGLLGMSTLWNNAGVAFLYGSRYVEAVECFQKGLRHRPDLTKQLGLMANLIIAKALAGEQVNESEIRAAVNHALIHFSSADNAFLAANNLMNVLKICPSDLALELVNELPLEEVLNRGLVGNLGVGSLTSQISANQKLVTELKLELKPIDKGSSSSGIRERFITTTGFNPAIYNVWF